ncbi:MAG: 3'-5' exoribonuclease [Candidatus Omnitrophica bacterium]|nr:3'-5' exoribonuclease [Candidatus Omnitrophota bacterium]
MKKLLNTTLDQIEFAVVDLETTGFCSKRDCVIEVAAVKIKSGEITEHYQSLIYAEHIPYHATRVHGIDMRMIEDAPSLNVVRNDFREFTSGCVLVGHNIKSFDMPFLCNAFEVEENTVCVDTLKLSRFLFAKERTHKLSVVAQRLGIKSDRYHRALDDTLVTAHIFLEFLKIGSSQFKVLKDIIA